MRSLFNKHTAEVAGIAPGKVGEVDDTLPGVEAFMRAGLLVDPATAKPAQAEAVATIDTLRAQLAVLEEKYADLEAQHIELMTQHDTLLARATAPASPAAPTDSPPASADAGSDTPAKGGKARREG